MNKVQVVSETTRIKPKGKGDPETLLTFLWKSKYATSISNFNCDKIRKE